MSFEVNGPGWEPVVKRPSAMENNGGGGNLGYFAQQKKEQEEKKKQEEEKADIFTKAKDDEFVLEEDQENVENAGEKDDIKPSVKEFFKEFIRTKSKKFVEKYEEDLEDLDNFFKKSPKN